MNRPGREWNWAIAWIALSACAYTSEYVAPPDGRARALMRDGTMVAVIPSDPRCAEAVATAVQAGGPEPSEYAPFLPPIGYAEIHVPVVVEGRSHDRSPRDFPRTPRVHQAGPAGGPGHHAAPAKAPASGGHSGSSTSSIGKAPELLVVAAVVALVALPIVAIALASSSPGDSAQSANAIDQVNAFNDLSRIPGSACAPAPTAPPGAAAPTAQGAPPPAPREPPPASPSRIPPPPAPGAEVVP